MKIVLLGTGCPQCHPHRFGPANLVVTPDCRVLVDCGSGVTQRLVQAGCPGRDLDAIVLTHLHSDHIIDIYQLIISSWHQGRDRPHCIYGPPGTRAYLVALMALWEEERNLRIAHEARTNKRAFELEVHEFGEGQIATFGQTIIDAVEVDHRPVRDAFGFVFRTPGHKAVFSGDTCYNENLIAAAENADLLVHECFIHRELLPITGTRTEEGLHNTAAYHTLSTEVGMVAARAGAKFLMLNHFVPPQFDREALVGEVSQSFDGPFAIGEDLMTFDLASGCLRHNEALVRIGLGACPSKRWIGHALDGGQALDVIQGLHGSAESVMKTGPS